jgi:hypothetical protein
VLVDGHHVDGPRAVNRSPSRLTDGATLAGGALLVLSSALHWVRRGPGATLRGHDLIDALVAIGRHVPALSSTRLAILWYLVPAMGALAWVVVGFASERRAVVRAHAIATAVIVAGVVLAFTRLTRWSRLGPGVPVALAGAALVLVAAFIRPNLRRSARFERARRRMFGGGQLSMGSSGYVDIHERMPRWRRSTRRQSESGSGVMMSSVSASTTHQAVSASSSSSWAGDQPA